MFSVKKKKLKKENVIYNYIQMTFIEKIFICEIIYNLIVPKKLT